MRVAYWPDSVRKFSCAVLALAAVFGIAGCSDQSTRLGYSSLNLAEDSSTGAGLATTASLPRGGGAYSAPAPRQNVSYSASQDRYYGTAASTRGAVPTAPSSPTPSSYGSSANYGSSPNDASGPKVTVQPGDTLSSLSQRYGVPIGTIQAANNLPDARLRDGQVLVLPGANLAAPAPAVQTASVTPAASPAPARKVRTTTIAAPSPAASAQTTQKAPATSSNIASTAPLPAPDPLSGNSFRWPVEGRVISGFGTKPDGGHNDGINISVPQGTPVKAAENGVVAYAGNELKGYGNLVLVRHANSWVSAYANNEQLLVKRGDKVSRGQVIAKAGSSGGASQSQVHFELRKGSRPVDPTKYMSSMAAQAN